MTNNNINPKEAYIELHEEVLDYIESEYPDGNYYREKLERILSSSFDQAEALGSSEAMAWLMAHPFTAFIITKNEFIFGYIANLKFAIGINSMLAIEDVEDEDFERAVLYAMYFIDKYGCTRVPYKDLTLRYKKDIEECCGYY